jgi:hypothetical protein
MLFGGAEHGVCARLPNCVLITPVCFHCNRQHACAGCRTRRPCCAAQAFVGPGVPPQVQPGTLPRLRRAAASAACAAPRLGASAHLHQPLFCIRVCRWPRHPKLYQSHPQGALSSHSPAARRPRPCRCPCPCSAAVACRTGGPAPLFVLRPLPPLPGRPRHPKFNVGALCLQAAVFQTLPRHRHALALPCRAAAAAAGPKAEAAAQLSRSCAAGRRRCPN